MVPGRSQWTSGKCFSDASAAGGTRTGIFGSPIGNFQNDCAEHTETNVTNTKCIHVSYKYRIIKIINFILPSVTLATCFPDSIAKTGKS